MPANPEETSSKKEKKSKKESKKESKKKRKRDAKTEETEEVKEPVKEKSDQKSDVTTDKEARREARKKERQARKEEKEALLEKVPKVDEDGIAYTKLQIKRMVKRVKQGLAPAPTEAEERERLRRDAEMRREEEAELAGLLYNRDEEDDEEEGNSEEPEEKDEDDDKDANDEEIESENATEPKEALVPPKKKAKRSKPVPPDYVCQACKNKHQPVHWIYDCPDKVTVRGTNQKAKKDRGFHDPDSRKVFVSGLPFDVKPGDVQNLFKGCGEVATCRLVKFGDTGRCNGQAYVSFVTDGAAEKALKLSGTTLDNEKPDKKKKGKKTEEQSRRKELKLKVTKVKNRRLTKAT
eukprot:Nitzschia sp. Nitz4//scaffold9_size221794//201390//202439//NITZ4_001384-RA/size221794-processed-gene-0.353-mRNA-1//-1//CDS//3329561115//6085//frame0